VPSHFDGRQFLLCIGPDKVRCRQIMDGCHKSCPVAYRFSKKREPTRTASPTLKVIGDHSELRASPLSGIVICKKKATSEMPLIWAAPSN
jgi:hypothetical protein